MKVQQINHRARLCQYYKYLLDNSESDQPIPNMKIIENPSKEDFKVDHRSRLFHYYRNLLDQAANIDDIKEINFVSSKVSEHPYRYNKTNRSEQTSQTQESSKKTSLAPHKKKGVKKQENKIYSTIIQQDTQYQKIKLPSIKRRDNSVEQAKSMRCQVVDHQLQSIKIDEMTLRLIEQNQRKKLQKYNKSKSIQIKETI